MTKLRIIDASVAIKWFVVEEAKHNEAMALLDEIQSSPFHFAVPELFYNEMLAVLCRLLDDSAQVNSYLYILEQLGFYRLGNGNELLTTAAQLAVKYQLSGYDAIYAASAKTINATWVTADQRAHKRIAALKISALL
jgi:predicted nucleic acid-binding protein